MTTDQTILVTGGFGFLGRAVARRFKLLGYRVVGIGRGHWAPQEAQSKGFDRWLDASVSLSSLMTLQEEFSLVVHCAGNGSVGYSLSNPLQDFHKTVQSTVDLLEYLRLRTSSALLIYPSSAGVYGSKPDVPIRESDALTPISPYGYHKKIAEDLLASYANAYGIRVAIIRFFSIYGPGLTKQLLWDASQKMLTAGAGAATFWGTGEETRDWIASDDAAELVNAASHSTAKFSVLNGASGRRVTIRETLGLLKEALDAPAEIVFNNAVREGDPRFYHADVTRSIALNWKPSITLDAGIANYAAWVQAHQRQERQERGA